MTANHCGYIYDYLYRDRGRQKKFHSFLSTQYVFLMEKNLKKNFLTFVFVLIMST